MAKDTEPAALMRWFGRDAVRVWRQERMFDPEGIFIGDASYLFVPDNPKYERSEKLLFDEHNHPISRQNFEKMGDEQKLRCQLRRCYKMVSLLHTNRNLEFFLFVGVRVIEGSAYECPVLFDMLEQLVQAAGRGEERHKQLKGFSDLTHFTSRAFSLVAHVEIIASANDEARRKLVDRSRRLQRELIGVMTKPRPPPFI